MCEANDNNNNNIIVCNQINEMILIIMKMRKYNENVANGK
jgi:hypothetical protein